ncbi:hypothetical protein KKF34_12105 [Myxococcota bacterium]|nr:hypothetical protein [Myxococcota bacterium]MBU1383056.1 hypothetical protein [Myxococcota bacterium]MBU1497607.1 hypothetical protein [Myxococcota bacterium]
MKYSIFLIVAPLAAAFTIPMLGTYLPRLSKLIAALMLLAGTALSAWLLTAYKAQTVIVIGGWMPPFGISLHVDLLSLISVTAVYGATLMATLYQLFDGQEKKPYFYMLILLLTAALNGMILTGDLFNLFVFMEIAGISSYALIASGNGAAGVRGALKYMIVASLASVAYLAAIAIIYSTAGSLNMATVASGMRDLNPVVGALVVLLILASVFTEMEIFPFNSWVPSAYQGAPSSVSALLSGAVTVAAAYVALRMSYIVFGQGMGDIIRYGKFNVTNILFWLGVITVITGQAAAYAQADAKKMLALSSVAQMGIILFAISIASDLAIYGIVFAVIAHSLSKLLLFMVTGKFVSASGTSHWAKWKGLGRENPLSGGLFLIGALGILGIPLFAGFWGKFSIIGAAFKAPGVSWIGVYIILAATVVEAVYFFRLAHLLFEEPETKPVSIKSSIWFRISTALLAAAIIGIGVYPAPIDKKVRKIPTELSSKNTEGYISTAYRAMGR